MAILRSTSYTMITCPYSFVYRERNCVPVVCSGGSFNSSASSFSGAPYTISPFVLQDSVNSNGLAAAHSDICNNCFFITLNHSLFLKFFQLFISVTDIAKLQMPNKPNYAQSFAMLFQFRQIIAVFPNRRHRFDLRTGRNRIRIEFCDHLHGFFY